MVVEIHYILFKEGKFKEPILMIFSNGSREACSSLVYIRWVKEDGHVECRLVTGKMQVAPKVKITRPRTELMDAVNAVRLAQKARDEDVR